MACFDTIYSLANPNGVSFKVTSDGRQVNIYRLLSGSLKYHVLARMDKQQWDKYADRFDVFNMNDQDPAKIAGIIDALYGRT